MMVVLGTDAHKKSHTIVACDEAGAQLGWITVAATPEGHLRAVKWAGRLSRGPGQGAYRIAEPAQVAAA